MVLKRGAKGPEVEKLQTSLKALGMLDGKPDGAFGAKTHAAVVAFQQAYLVDGLADEVTLAAIDKAVAAWAKKLGGATLIPVPKGLAEIEAQFGKIAYKPADGGFAIITNGWAEENIVVADLPVVGKQQVHKLMVPVFTAVMQMIKDRGLDDDIITFGVWSPRFKMHNPKNNLSTHSWAIACDVNAATNMPGVVGDIAPGIVECFEAHGFEWGGRWRARDDMHFQLATGY